MIRKSMFSAFRVTLTIVMLLVFSLSVLLLDKNVVEAAPPFTPPTVIIGISGMATTIDPFVPVGPVPLPGVSVSGPGLAVKNNVFETLVATDTTNNIMGNLAFSWSYSSDCTSLTVHLKQGISFSSGESFIADDVIFSLQRAKSVPGTLNNQLLSAVFFTTDDYTIYFTFQTGNPNFLKDTLGALPIVSRLSATVDSNGFLTNPIGTGPYKISLWDPTKKIELSVNEYYRSSPPQIKSAKFLYVPDDFTRINGYNKPGFDMIDIPTEKISSITRDYIRVDINNDLVAIMTTGLTYKPSFGIPQGSPTNVFDLIVNGICGRVVDIDSSQPIIGVQIVASLLSETGSIVQAFSTVTDNSGYYQIWRVPLGPYMARASANNYIGQYYNNRYFQTEYDVVRLTTGSPTIENIDFMLKYGAGSISGRVLEEGTELPVQGSLVRIDVFDGTKWIIAYVIPTKPDGYYKSPITLKPGDYRVAAFVPFSYVAEYYRDSFESSNATPVTVCAGQNTPNIDFTIRPTPVAHAGGPYLVQVGTPVNLTGIAYVAAMRPIITYNWDFGDGTNYSGTDPNVSHTYLAAGIYDTTFTVIDNKNATNSDQAMVIVYDPSGGFVTGGGWIDSIPGAYSAAPTMTGKATFGFEAKYLKGATIPEGNTAFRFKAGDLNFESTSYDWLVVNQNGANAQFKGIGTINGEGSYKFMLWATDGSPDTFRIQIIDTFGTKVYDNGAEQALGGGNIIVHKAK